MYQVLLRDTDERTQFIDSMKKHSISCVFHYIPLHGSPLFQSSKVLLLF